MSVNEMAKKAHELRQLQELIEEANTEIESIKDELKAAMGDTEEIRAGGYKISWKAVKSTRIDTAALKKAMPEIAAAFAKETTTRRFVVA